MIRVNPPLTHFLLPVTLVLITGCEGTLPPLRGKAEIGQDPYVVFVGGNGRSSDLYAVRGDGGSSIPITFTPVAELAPALAPDGGSVAFLRARSLSDSTPATVWVLNLLSGMDRELPLPRNAGLPIRLGWSRDGTSLIVRTEAGMYRLAAPPRKMEPQPVSPAERVAAESSLAVLLGDPAFARVVPCRTGELCVVGESGGPGFLARGAQEALRWGPDSVGIVIDERVEIRPLGPGRPRRLSWTNLPEHPRQLTFFAGKRELPGDSAVR